MQREIKFRAWDKKEGVLHARAGITPHGDFCYAEALKNGGSQWHQFDDKHIEKYRIYYAEDVILMQFTGLHDKNGKEIYEGDIVNYDNKGFSRGLPGLVEWAGSGFYIAKHIPLVTLVSKFDIDFEIIGNIYENPTLLTGTH